MSMVTCYNRGDDKVGGASRRWHERCCGLPLIWRERKRHIIIAGMAGVEDGGSLGGQRRKITTSKENLARGGRAAFSGFYYRGRVTPFRKTERSNKFSYFRRTYMN